MNKLDLEEILELWNCDIDNKIIQGRYKFDSTFQDLTSNEFEESILHFLKVLDGDLSQAGPHRKNDWEDGWRKNLENFKESKKLEDLLPGYFEKSQIIRWKRRWVKPNDPGLEQKLLAILVDSLLVKHGILCDSIYEFGCGTGHHLFRIRDLFPEKKLVGLDWTKSSQDLISTYAELTDDSQLFAYNFDFFTPNYSLEIDSNSCFLTVASLEQTGDNFTEFIDFILHLKPRVVINIEPMEEFLDSDHLLDRLSLKYFSARKYLSKYFSYLTKLELQGKIEIRDARRSYLGSFFIDGYSIVVWSPN